MRGFSCLLWTLLFAAGVWVCLDFISWEILRPSQGQEERDPDGPKVAALMQALEEAPVMALKGQPKSTTNGGRNCTYYKCFDIYRCGSHPKKMLVHIPSPLRIQFRNSDVSPVTRDFAEVLEAVVRSGYYTEDPDEACVFFPAFNLLSEAGIEPDLASEALEAAGKPNGGGKNSLVFTPYPSGNKKAVDIGKAMRAAAGMTALNYRAGFDIALPSYSQFQEEKLEKEESPSGDSERRRKWLVVMPQKRVSNPDLLQQVEQMAEMHPQLLKIATGSSPDEKYPEVMNDATFCLVVDLQLDCGRVLSDAMHRGCIPVISTNLAVLPFSEVLDWKRFSVQIYEHDLQNAMDILMDVSPRKIREMRAQLDFVYAKYFRSWASIVQTTLDILNDRIVPHRARNYRDWNLRPEEKHRNPLFMPNASPPNSEGFTAVVLTYDRVESLFNVISRIADTPSLSRIVVVWNNQEQAPPIPSAWPKISKPLKVIKTRSNVLSNRFYPYDEITTEAVLSLDDDISMLTADELELGYQVWREFPDRLVGFPSRTHVVDHNTGQYRYESEWTSDISMVLTGAAFYHRYWHYLYTATPDPAAQEIKQWVDDHMNCEDIAMNFLIANATGHPPIKVAPRKKFKCSTAQCLNQELSLSGQHNHMVARSECINLFAEKYGYLPLKSVDFRVDPVLYKDQVPDKLKRFVNVGSL